VLRYSLDQGFSIVHLSIDLALTDIGLRLGPITKDNIILVGIVFDFIPDRIVYWVKGIFLIEGWEGRFSGSSSLDEGMLS